MNRAANVLPAFLLSAYPLSFVLAANAGVNAIDWIVVAKILVAGFALTALLLVALRPVVRETTTRSLLVSTALLLLSFYGFLMFEARSLGWRADPRDLGVAAAYTAFCIGVATLVARPWKTGRRDLVPMTILAVVLLGTNSYMTVSRTSGLPRSRWLGAADKMIATASPSPAVVPAVRRDIYYIVLDMLGRKDTINQYFGADLGGFESFLRSKGFYVADQARSNYAQTYLSLASLLNLNYLDPLVSAIGEDAQERAPLDYLIQQNALMRLAKQAGYEVTAIGSDYEATLDFPAADTCYCKRRWLDDYTQAVVEATPLAALSGQWPYIAHRDKVLESLDLLGTPGSSPGPRFVFAHILLPHPPFMFAPDGLFRPPGWMFTFADGGAFPGTRQDYVRGYHDQVLFAVRRMTALIDSILTRPGPTPVIVLHGDHGPGSMLDWEDATKTNMPERMSILAAYLFPEGGRQLYSTMTPVNGVRVLANEYLGVALPLLPDRSAFSTWNHPYRFVAVPAEDPSQRP